MSITLGTNISPIQVVIYDKKYEREDSGITVEEENWRYDYDTEDDKAIKEFKKLQSEERLKKLCRDLGVRIGGM